MIRPLLIELALFSIPFVAYALFLWFTKRPVVEMAAWPARTLATLAIIALVIVLGSFFVLAQFGGAPPGAYVPAHIDETGKFVPGQVQ